MEELDDESSDAILNLKADISKLTSENENYRQELHELQRKLATNVKMQAELTQLNEELEQTHNENKVAATRRMHEIEEKHLQQRKELQERLGEAEAEVVKKVEENRELREIIRSKDEKLLAMSQMECSISKEDDSEKLKSQMEELTELFVQEEEARKYLEEALQCKEFEYSELRNILASTRTQLIEKNELLESTKDELQNIKIELDSLKETPATDTAKGNSLFAEVEDRRRKMLDQMTAMRNSYIQAKRSFQTKEAEIKALKAERAMLLQKWEDDNVEAVEQNASLMEKYKARIGQLELQLNDERKKLKQTEKSQPVPEHGFKFLQSLVDTKKKEVEDLSTKLENASIKALLEEETKYKIGKQLRYWRYRAMSIEAQLLSIQSHLESDPSSSKMEMLENIKICLKGKEPQPDESLNCEISRRNATIVNETVVSLDSLMNMPKYLSLSDCETEIKTSETKYNIQASCDERIASTESMLLLEESVIENFNTKPTVPEIQKIREKKATFDEETTSGSLVSILKPLYAKPDGDVSAFFSRENTSVMESKKSLRFTDDTIDPPQKKLVKKPEASKPSYPVVYISSNNPTGFRLKSTAGRQANQDGKENKPEEK